MRMARLTRGLPGGSLLRERWQAMNNWLWVAFAFVWLAAVAVAAAVLDVLEDDRDGHR